MRDVDFFLYLVVINRFQDIFYNKYLFYTLILLSFLFKKKDQSTIIIRLG